MRHELPPVDAVLLLSFGGPEGPDDVVPFLQNVTRGRNIPRERLEDVGKHYFQFGGVSPINAQCRELVTALRVELACHGPDLPVYWGNRNWHPLLGDTLAQMADNGVRRAVAVATSAYSSYWLPNIHELLSGVKRPAILRLSRERLVTRTGHRFVRATVAAIDPSASGSDRSVVQLRAPRQDSRCIAWLHCRNRRIWLLLPMRMEQVPQPTIPLCPVRL